MGGSKTERVKIKSRQTDRVSCQNVKLEQHELILQQHGAQNGNERQTKTERQRVATSRKKMDSNAGL